MMMGEGISGFNREKSKKIFFEKKGLGGGGAGGGGWWGIDLLTI